MGWNGVVSGVVSGCDDASVKMMSARGGWCDAMRRVAAASQPQSCGVSALSLSL